MWTRENALFNRSAPAVLGVLVGVVALTAPIASSAVTFQKTSIIVTPAELAKGVDYPLIGLIDQKAPVFLSIRAYAWSQTPDNQMILTPTTDITTFPQLLRVDAGANTSVRVQSTRSLDDTSEHYYRLVLEEFPPLETKAVKVVPTVQIRSRPRVTVPIVVAPAREERREPLEITGPRSGAGSPSGSLMLHNTGNTVLVVKSLASTVSPATRVPVGVTILAGSTIAVPLPKAISGDVEIIYSTAKNSYVLRHAVH